MVASTIPAGLRRAAQKAADARSALADARDHALVARSTLADHIRTEADERLGSVAALIGIVSARLGLAPRTVRNALYERFTPHVLSACVDVLAETAVASARQAA